MTSKRKLRRRIEELEMALELAETRDLPSAAFVPIQTFIKELKGSSTTSLAPWCSICGAWHEPGAGRCTATYTWTSPSTGSLQ